MVRSMHQKDLANRLSIELEIVTREALAVASGLSDEQLSWSDGGWSIGRIFEHLVLAAEGYFGKIRGRIFDPHAAHIVTDAEPEWEPSLIGWMLVRRMRSSRPLPVPGSFAPGPAPRPDVVHVFEQRQKT